jgi:hypothetical protein
MEGGPVTRLAKPSRHSSASSWNYSTIAERRKHFALREVQHRLAWLWSRHMKQF